jgi:hypothetical protein
MTLPSAPCNSIGRTAIVAISPITLQLHGIARERIAVIVAVCHRPAPDASGMAFQTVPLLGGAIGREALDVATVAKGASIKAGDRPRGPRHAVPLPRPMPVPRCRHGGERRQHQARRSAARPSSAGAGAKRRRDQARQAPRGAPPRSARRSMPCRRARTVAGGGAIGREALDAATVASGASIKPGDLSRGPRRTVPPRRYQCRQLLD